MKLTQEELELLKQTQLHSKNLITEFGQITLAEETLKERKSNAIEYLKKLKVEETKIAKQLEEKYGKGAVDIDTGEFIPS